VSLRWSLKLTDNADLQSIPGKSASLLPVQHQLFDQVAVGLEGILSSHDMKLSEYAGPHSMPAMSPSFLLPGWGHFATVVAREGTPSSA